MRKEIAIILAAGLAIAHALPAASVVSGVSYSGTFANDADKRMFYFNLTQPGVVTVRTWSYAGGVNAAGARVPAGGFDPTISIFDASGYLVAYNRDGGCGTVAADPTTSRCWDSYVSMQLPTGDYKAVVTQAENLPNGPNLAQSFVYDPALCPLAVLCPVNAQGNFTTAPGTAPAGFWDFTLAKRTAAYAIDIVGASSVTGTAITSSSTINNGIAGLSYAPFTFTAQSGPQAVLTWSLASGTALPPGLTLNPSTGVLSGGPQFAGNYSFAVQVFDGFQFSLPQTVTMTVYSQLHINTSSLPSGVYGQPYSASVSASGGSGNYTWNIFGLPAGLSGGSSGSISGTPTALSNGQISITVTDAGSEQSASAYLSISITAPPVVLTGNSNLGDVAAGSAVVGSYSASGGVAPYRWSLAGASFLSVDGSGNVRGTASQAGNFSPVLTVTDSLGTSSSTTLSLAVLGLTGSFPAGTTTSSYRGSAGGVGGVPPYVYTASGIPQGLTFSGGVLTGQPKTRGTYTIGVRVTDSQGVSVSGNFSFTITGPAPILLTISTTVLPDGFVGQPYSQALSASGGAPGYTWIQTGGQLPAGLSFSNGTVSGTPSTAGSFSLGVQVTDSSGGHALTVVALNIQPAQLRITSGAALPEGMVVVDYPTQILTADGGTQPYTFSLKGALPAGLTLSNGQIFGTPSVAGDFGFTLVVTDSAVNAATASLAVTGTIKPNAADLVLSSATAPFSLTSGTSATPLPATIQVSSSAVSQVLTFAASSSVPWATVGGSASTPGSITVGLNNAALALSSTGSPYSGTVTVTCTALACAGKSQSIAVSLTVAAAPPQLTLGSPLLSFAASPSNLQASSAALSIVNAGGGSLAIQFVAAADSWLTVGSFPSGVLPGPGGTVTITANPAGLKPGYYLSSVTVFSAAGNASVPVTLLISAASEMTLGPAGTQFSMPQGGALGNGNGSFLVSVSSGSASFSAAVLPGAAWLSGGGTGNTSVSSPGTVSFSINPTAAAALGAGAYYGTIRVSGAGLLNSPQDFQVILNISAATSRVIPDPEPAGLVFIGSSAALPPQTIQLFASSRITIAYQASASPIDGSGWLSVSPPTGSTSAASPASVQVTANPAGLRPGVYRGTVSFSFATSVRSVNVTLIVQASLAGAALPSITSKETGSRLAPRDTPVCAGAQLVPTQTGLVSNFSAPASWPTPLAIKLFDTCGNVVNGGQIVTTFSNGDPPLILSATDSAHSLYSGTWTPRKTSSQVTILARASVPGYSTATVQIAGQVAPNVAPVLAPHGTFDIFHPQFGAGLGPGNIVQIYGSGLAGQIGAPSVLPLPTQVNGTSVIIGGVSAPIYYVSPGQINAQIPFELGAGNEYQVIVNANGALTTPQPIQLTPAVPAILQFNSGAVVAQHLDGTLILETSPAAPGENVVIYLTGLGATDINVPSGTASPSNPLANVVDQPVLTLNGTTIPTSFAGLTPTLVGLYQINFQVPQGLPSGEYNLVISQSGTVSNQTILPVKAAQ